jgi:hypothetical protein
MSILRPAEVCSQLLAALEASEGRRQRRKRNTTPDAIGLTLKREILQRAVQDDPEPTAFESWLLRYCQVMGRSDGPVRAMALEVLAEWQLATTSPGFWQWLQQGAPSDDARA